MNWDKKQKDDLDETVANIDSSSLNSLTPNPNLSLPLIDDCTNLVELTNISAGDILNETNAFQMHNNFFNDTIDYEINNFYSNEVEVFTENDPYQPIVENTEISEDIQLINKLILLQKHFEPETIRTVLSKNREFRIAFFRKFTEKYCIGKNDKKNEFYKETSSFIHMTDDDIEKFWKVHELLFTNWEYYFDHLDRPKLLQTGQFQAFDNYPQFTQNEIDDMKANAKYSEYIPKLKRCSKRRYAPIETAVVAAATKTNKEVKIENLLSRLRTRKQILYSRSNSDNFEFTIEQNPDENINNKIEEVRNECNDGAANDDDMMNNIQVNTEQVQFDRQENDHLNNLINSADKQNNECNDEDNVNKEQNQIIQDIVNDENNAKKKHNELITEIVNDEDNEFITEIVDDKNIETFTEEKNEFTIETVKDEEQKNISNKTEIQFEEHSIEIITDTVKDESKQIEVKLNNETKNEDVINLAIDNLIVSDDVDHMSIDTEQNLIIKDGADVTEASSAVCDENKQCVCENLKNNYTCLFINKSLPYIKEFVEYMKKFSDDVIDCKKTELNNNEDNINETISQASSDIAINELADNLEQNLKSTKTENSEIQITLETIDLTLDDDNDNDEVPLSTPTVSYQTKTKIVHNNHRQKKKKQLSLHKRLIEMCTLNKQFFKNINFLKRIYKFRQMKRNKKQSENINNRKEKADCNSLILEEIINSDSPVRITRSSLNSLKRSKQNQKSNAKTTPKKRKYCKPVEYVTGSNSCSA